MELRLPQIPNTTKFIKGRVPPNKGKKISEYMSVESQTKLLQCLEIHRCKINHAAGWNKKKVVAIKDNKFWVFESIRKASEISGVNYKNIHRVCNKKRKTAGGYQWFYENDNQWTSLINQ